MIEFFIKIAVLSLQKESISSFTVVNYEFYYVGHKWKSNYD